MLTNREIFDKVSAHLLTQGQQSRTESRDDMCMYRTPEGLSCAVGCLIPAGCYLPEFDNAPNTAVVRMSQYPAFVSALAKGGVDLRDPSVKALLSDLQAVHDNVNVSRWPAKLAHLLTTHESLT